MKFKFKVIFLFFLLLFSTITVQAEERKDEWKNTEFDFNNIKTILISTSINPECEIDEFSTRKLDSFYVQEFFQEGKWRKSKFRFINLTQLEEQASKITGIDMNKLEVESPVVYKLEMEKVIPDIADAILNIEVIAFGYDKIFVPESSHIYTEQIETEVEAEIQDSNGKWVKKKMKIKQPVERITTTPAHYNNYGNAGVTYTLVATKNNEKIWMLLDVREALAKEPIDMLERIIIRATKQVAKL